MPIHYPLAPSSSDRWLNCGASLNFKDDMTSPEAAEGTRLHDLAYEILTDHPIQLHPSDAAIIMPYVNFVRKSIDDISGDADIYYEKTIEHPAIKDFGGTIDCCIFDRGERELHVIDFKSGFKRVQAENNTQLGCYLLLACYDLTSRGGFQIENYRATIVQPRIDFIRTASFTLVQLCDLSDKIRRVNREDYNDGHWCEYCPHLHDCDKVRARLETFKEYSLTGEL